MIDIDVQLARSTGFTLDATFSAPDQGVTALFGRSGCGKTTIIQIVAGSVRPDSGRVQVGDVVFFDAKKGINLPIEKRHVGYVFQDSRLFPHMSVESNLRYGERRSRGERSIAFEAVIEMLGIGHLLRRRPHTLSGGEKQRVAIGRALLSQPRLLLMDEPLASLDEMRKGEILPYLELLRDSLGIPILYVSHSIEEVMRLADMVVAMKSGAVLASGPLAPVLSRPDVAPVLGRFDVGTIFECVVTAHDEPHSLSVLSFDDSRIYVPQVDAPVGARVRARVRSRDVSISLAHPCDTSVTNSILGKVKTITPEEGPYVTVEIALRHGALNSLVTSESVERLRLAPGMEVWAMIKAVAVDSRSRDFDGPGSRPPGREAPKPASMAAAITRNWPAVG